MKILTFSLDFFKLVSEYIDDVKVGDDHAESKVTESVSHNCALTRVLLDVPLV